MLLQDKLLTLKVIFYSLIFTVETLFAQTSTIGHFKANEDSIKSLFQTISLTRSDPEKLTLNQKIDSLFARIVRQPASFEYSFDSIRTVGHIYSPDRAFRILNWNIPLEDGTYKYFGYIQTLNSKTNIYRSFRLNDLKEEITVPENKELDANKWYGALYYSILKQNSDRNTYYTLLALQYCNLNLSKKIIEVLTFNETGKPVFGAPIFQMDNQFKYRIIFQYAAQASMNLRYDKKLKMIVFDHLSPFEQRYTGEYEYYGPDLSFDGFEFKNNLWVFHSNIDLRQPAEPNR